MMHIDSREHYYICNDKQVVKYKVDANDPNVIMLDNTKFKKETTLHAEDGIRSDFQWSSHKQASGENVV